MNEKIIRSKLFKKLNNYFPNLYPIKEEVYLNMMDKKAFIDILAKDKNDNYVIIELKRSNQASRQALHEILKYTEFVKSNYAVNGEHIKLIILSTKWDELLIPFSAFVQDNSSLQLKGIQLSVDSNGNYLNHKQISPIHFDDELLFAPRQMYNFYLNKHSLNNGIKSYSAIMKKHAIKDYVLLVLKKPNSIDYGHNFKYIIYFSMLRRNKNEYTKMLEKINNCEVTYLADRDYDRNGLASYEKAIIMSSLPKSDSMTEQSKSNNLDVLILKDQWNILSLRRFGRIQNNILSDTTIIREMLGYTGNGDVIYNTTMDLSETNKIDRLRKKSIKLFSQNQFWQSQFSIIIEKIIRTYSLHDKLEINIYNPTNIFLSIYQQLKFCQESSDMTSLPFFKINISNLTYIGVLIWKKNSEYDYDLISKKIYKNELDFFYKTQTNHILYNDLILECLDLEYSVMEVDNLNNTTKYFYNGIFKETKSVKDITDFIKDEKEFIDKLMVKFGSTIGL